MKAYVPLPNPCDDYQMIRDNGMWYLHWQGGYDDVLARGYPRPKFKTTILCELHSPNVADFLHNGGTEVPFLVTDNTKLAMRKLDMTGFRFASVEVVKIATLGTRKRRQESGEPEDSITKKGNMIQSIKPPILHAVYVIGRMTVAPANPSGRAPDRRVSPFVVPTSDSMPDLWQPYIKSGKLASWTFCSERFKQAAETQGWSNITFEPAQDWVTSMVGSAT
jgi:hypothetical protein